MKPLTLKERRNNLLSFIEKLEFLEMNKERLELSKIFFPDADKAPKDELIKKAVRDNFQRILNHYTDNSKRGRMALEFLEEYITNFSLCQVAKPSKSYKGLSWCNFHMEMKTDGKRKIDGA